MINKFFLLLFLFSISLIGYTQNYFQQFVSYDIKVILNDTNHSLTGYLTLDYQNNAPDELEYIYFHLWPNAYKNNETHFAQEQIKFGSTHFFYSKEQERGYIDSLSFTIDGKPAAFIIDPGKIDVGRLMLNEKLKPGEKIKIKTPFYVKIPEYFSRLAHIENDYYITQWYPKPAVYDQLGWHSFSYLDQGEFYSEFGDYKVDMYVPSDYMIAATGNHSITPFLEADIDSIMTKHNLKKYKKLRFEESNIHDFAWFANKNFAVQERIIRLPESNRRIKLKAYHAGKILPKYKNAIQFLEEAVLFYSKYGLEYPYETCKIVIGDFDGGMEYPTISLIGPVINELDFEDIIVHEVGHNWFYGILGFNERNFPWMDEGINSFYELLYMQKKYTNESHKNKLNDIGSTLTGLNEYSTEQFYKMFYSSLTSKRSDQPLNLSSEEYDEDNYGGIVYFKAALAIKQLMIYLGEDAFLNLMKGFFEEWKFKHPSPDDFKNYFVQNSTKNLDWFFGDLYNSTKTTDYKIKGIKKDRVLIENKGELYLPLTLTFKSNNSSFDTLFFPNNKPLEVTIPKKEIKTIYIDPLKNPLDKNEKNNGIKTSGLLPKADPLKIKFLGVYEKPGYDQINFSPLFGWNNYDKFMPGIIFYQSPVPYHNFDYLVLPMYGSASNELTGTASFEFNLYPSQIFEKVNFNTGYSRYSIIHDYAPYNKLHVKTKLFLSETQSEKSYFSLDYYYLNIPLDYINGDKDLKNLLNVSYTFSNNQTIKFSKAKLMLEGGKGFVKSSFELNNEWKFSNKSAIDVRFFTGAFLYESNSYYGNYNFRLSGWNGIQDYKYNNTFLGRSEIPGNDSLGILERQFVKADGGFTTYTFLGQTNKWIVATNFSYKPPIMVPIKPYFNIAVVSEKSLPKDTSPLFWESGIEIIIIPDIFEVYFPIFMSPNLKKQSNSISEIYWDKVRFTLNLDLLNPLKTLKNYY